MSAPPYMRLFVADFVADIQDLSTEEIGSYFLLTMHYWRHGGLPAGTGPDDEDRLARIAKLTPERWQCVRNAMLRIFLPKWKHKRIDAELERASAKSLKATMSANNRWKDKQEVDRAFARRMQSKRTSGRNANQNQILDPYVQPVLGPSGHRKSPVLLSDEARALLNERGSEK